MNRDSNISSTGAWGANDQVTVTGWADEQVGGFVMVVLKVNCGGTPSASVASNGAVRITASGSGTDYYLTITLNVSTVDNWSIQVSTSGGSTYTFTKGTGGGGHKG